ncbi:PTS transporter subunit EIIC [Actinomyces vulturis]|uniref:PTS transporter subunit EIIC n=1 Tax=Actinomyces vulturis TaxID=1857645 RepID=UPI00082D8AC9|nr:PTS transporter subunit EIIC [Actinomyces vulturis]
MSTQKKKGGAFAAAQRLGRSLMLPIATLPAAGLLLRLGQPDLLGADGLSKHITWFNPVAEVLAAAGGAIFGHLPLIFAVGIAAGLAKKADGSTAVAALIGYLVLEGTFDVLAQWWGRPADDPKINYGVLAGIIMGIVSAKLWEKYYRTKLPDWLAFFGGRRFVPIVTSVAAIFIGIIMGIIYPAFNWLINETVGGWLMENSGNPVSSFVFGFVNRLLIPFGLHHLWNALPWFQLGECTNAAGDTVNGDLNCFFSGVEGTNAWTGSFMTGFFPIMMFALPAAALAMWHTAKPERRKATGALMVSVALTAFLTGITEPLEYSFAYVAFPLYVVHAVLTGTSLVVVNALGIKDGFTFSAGLFDYLLNFGKSADLSGGVFQGPILLAIIGLIYAVIYYFLFRFIITKFNFPTPGREDDDTDGFAAAQAEAAERTGKKNA